jgi:hypothetical protein
LLERKNDWETAIKIPIFQIPGGSANALACNIAHVSNEYFRQSRLEDFATTMTFTLIKSKPKPLDIAVIQLADQSVIHSFLCIEWAIIADVVALIMIIYNLVISLLIFLLIRLI